MAISIKDIKKDITLRSCAVCAHSRRDENQRLQCFSTEFNIASYLRDTYAYSDCEEARADQHKCGSEGKHFKFSPIKWFLRS